MWAQSAIATVIKPAGSVISATSMPVMVVSRSAVYWHLHDSQVAIPLAEITNQRITHCYDLMDAAYDAPLIRQHSQSLGHVALIDENPRTKVRKAEIAEEKNAVERQATNLQRIFTTTNAVP
jgi:hypothetical protein